MLLLTAWRNDATDSGMEKARIVQYCRCFAVPLCIIKNTLKMFIRLYSIIGKEEMLA